MLCPGIRSRSLSHRARELLVSFCVIASLLCNLPLRDLSSPKPEGEHSSPSILSRPLSPPWGRETHGAILTHPSSSGVGAGPRLKESRCLRLMVPSTSQASRGLPGADQTGVPVQPQPAGSSWELLPGKVTRAGAGLGLALGLETSGVSR